MAKVLKANIIAGFIPGIAAPIIWPIVIFFTEGRLPYWPTYPMAALSISFFAIIIGLVMCVAIGVPTIIVLIKTNTNTPVIAGVSGMIMATLIFLLFKFAYNYPPLSQSWPLATFIAITGALCGSSASYMSRTNKSLNQIGANGAPPG